VLFRSIRVAYKKLALQWHPDKNEDKIFAEQKFKKICGAFRILRILFFLDLLN
jgi:DnaJ-class molecular chaperone